MDDLEPGPRLQRAPVKRTVRPAQDRVGSWFQDAVRGRQRWGHRSLLLVPETHDHCERMSIVELVITVVGMRRSGHCRRRYGAGASSVSDISLSGKPGRSRPGAPDLPLEIALIFGLDLTWLGAARTSRVYFNVEQEGLMSPLYRDAAGHEPE